MNIKKLNVILILSVISVSLHGSEAIRAMNLLQDAEEVSPPASPAPPVSPVIRAVEHVGPLYPNIDDAEPAGFLCDPMVRHTKQREVIKALQPVTDTAGTVWAYTPDRVAVAQGALDATYGVRRLVLDGVVVVRRVCKAGSEALEARINKPTSDGTCKSHPCYDETKDVYVLLEKDAFFMTDLYGSDYAERPYMQGVAARVSDKFYDSMVKKAAREITLVGSDWEKNIITADVSNEMIREESAIKIQALVRGHRTRKVLEAAKAK